MSTNQVVQSNLDTVARRGLMISDLISYSVKTNTLPAETYLHQGVTVETFEKLDNLMRILGVAPWP